MDMVVVHLLELQVKVTDNYLCSIPQRSGLSKIIITVPPIKHSHGKQPELLPRNSSASLGQSQTDTSRQGRRAGTFGDLADTPSTLRALKFCNENHKIYKSPSLTLNVVLWHPRKDFHSRWEFGQIQKLNIVSQISNKYNAYFGKKINIVECKFDRC